MRITAVVFVLTANIAFGQNDYIIKTDGEQIKGYARRFYSATESRNGIELWRAKNDKNPLRILVKDLDEYAMRNHTFVVLHNVKPFTNSSFTLYHEECNLISRGKLELMVAHHVDFRKDVALSLLIAIGTGGPGAADSYIYLIRDRATNRILGIPKKETERNKVLKEFLPEHFLNDFLAKNSLRYSKIPKLIELYNSTEN